MQQFVRQFSVVVSVGDRQADNSGSIPGCDLLAPFGFYSGSHTGNRTRALADCGYSIAPRQDVCLHSSLPSAGDSSSILDGQEPPVMETVTLNDLDAYWEVVELELASERKARLKSMLGKDMKKRMRTTTTHSLFDDQPGVPTD
ncbi:hypothetical protein Bbelb_317320 [Branchiostoma belcheri]|nr:hypothetical protein Bbelb_317320 [Branchiostoma belcheri]